MDAGTKPVPDFPKNQLEGPIYWPGLFQSWIRWPAAARWMSAIAAVLVLDSLIPALSADHRAAAIGQNLIALTLHYGFSIGSFALAFYAGFAVHRRSDVTWAGWLAGLTVFVGTVLLQDPVAEFLDVSERLDSLQNPDCHIEWDGRSNPTVCD